VRSGFLRSVDLREQTIAGGGNELDLPWGGNRRGEPGVGMESDFATRMVLNIGGAGGDFV